MTLAAFCVRVGGRTSWRDGARLLGVGADAGRCFSRGGIMASRSWSRSSLQTESNTVRSAMRERGHPMRRTLVNSNAASSLESGVPTAAALVIGDEILTGKVQDANTFWLGRFLFERGVFLDRVEVVRDRQDSIAEAVKRLSDNHTFVFTTGGIGSTHDDITYESIAAGFGLSVCLDEEIVSEMKKYTDREITDPMKRMATLPSPCQKIKIDGLWTPIAVVADNVFILPGIPSLFQRMLENAGNIFGSPSASFCRRAILTSLRETELAEALTEIDRRWEQISFGSYILSDYQAQFGVKITIEGRDLSEVEKATAEVQASFEALGGSVVEASD